MPRVLFDKNVPYTLKLHLVDHQVKTAEEEGWGQISNGELIRRAENAGYRILLTCDQNISHQQNMTNRQISMLVLGSNIWPSIRPKVEQILEALKRVSPGSFELIEIAPPREAAKGGRSASAMGSLEEGLASAATGHKTGSLIA